MWLIGMKNRLTYLIAWLGYWLGVDRLFYALNHRCKRVLTFHNVFPDHLNQKDDGGGMSLRVSDFKRIIAEVGKVYSFSADLDDYNTATITFDDGFLNQYEVASEALGEIPAVLFVAGRNIDRDDPFAAPAVDLLTVWLANVPPDALMRLAKSLRVEAPTNRLRFWIEVVRPLYVADAAHYGCSVVDRCEAIYPFAQVFGKLGVDYLRLRLGGITTQQLNDLRARGWKVGWHSANHFALAAIPDNLKMHEFDAPPEIKKVPMSYPYGELQSVSEKDIACARSAGFPSAYSNLPEINRRQGRYFLPRFTVGGNKIMLHFHLSGFRHFLKHRKLLPRGEWAR